MNGPQRTACLAKGFINNQHQLTIPSQLASSMVANYAQLENSLVTSMYVRHVGQTEHGQTDIREILRLASSFARQ